MSSAATASAEVEQLASTLHGTRVNSDDRTEAKVQMAQPISPTTVLLQWLDSFGVNTASTGLVMWEGNGSEEERGLRSQRSIKRNRHFNQNEAGEDVTVESSSSASDSTVFTAPVICIPEALLITPSKVRNSTLIQTIWGKPQANRATDSELLCSFLIHQHRLGSKSKWSPYINTLPKHYTSIEWWNDKELAACQIEELVRLARQRRETVRREWTKCKHMQLGNRKTAAESEVQVDAPLPYHWSDSICRHICDESSSNGVCTPTQMCSPPTLAEYQWAWATVSTRSCFLPTVSEADNTSTHPTSTASMNSTTSSDSASASDINRSCLIPYLDMLNHHAEVMVDCRLTSRQYELYIVEPSPYELKAGSELFINYGSHSNRILVERYGFALVNNRHERIELSLQQVDRALSTPHALITDAQYSMLTTPWILPPHLQSSSSSSESSPLALTTCSCAKNYSITESLASKWPKYRTPFPGIADKVEEFQLKLLRACGLYELSDTKDESVHSAASSTSNPYSFRLFPCSLSADLSLYLRIRALTQEDVQVALSNFSPSSTKLSEKSAAGAKGGKLRTVNAASSWPLSDADASVLAELLLDDRTPYLSPTHRAVTQRLVLELVLSELLNPVLFGRTSIQTDFDSYLNTEMPYVHQIAFILRVSQKRMLHSILVHILME